MAVLKLIGFVGENPKITPRLLGDMSAQMAYNVRLDDGALTPVRKKRFDYQFADPPPGGYTTIYKDAGGWLGWAEDVYAVPGPVATDRLYILGDGAPKMRVAGVIYPLAVPFPASALTATLGGTPTPGASGTTRLYVYTWVTSFGEESEPSPISADVFWTPGQTTTLSGFASPPAGRSITLQRIYRAQTGKTGTQLYFIAERAATNADFADTVSPELLQEVLPSANWNAPPDDMTGLIALPNGMMAAFSGKQLCFCEPYRPHAWPESYRLTMDYDIVGLGAFSSSVIVTTKGTPYIVNGSAPENMTSERIEQNLPCINARGIVDLGYSVAYPSHDGLVQVTSSGAVVATTSIFSRDDWLRLNPYNMVADQYNGRYFTSFSYTDVTGTEFRGIFIIDLSGQQAFLIRTDVQAEAMYYDLPTGQLYLLKDASVYEWDALSEPSALLSWKSKLFVLPKPTNFGAILVESDVALTPEQVAAIEAEIASLTAQNAAIFAQESIGGEIDGAALGEFALNGDELLKVPTLSRNTSVSIYADRKLVATVGAVNRMARLPAGFLATLWEVEVSSDTSITQITLAGTGQELAGVGA
jgi:hypothetical protein